MVGDSLCRYQYEIENVPWGSVRQQTRPIRPSMPMCLQASSYLIIYLVSSSLRLYSSCHKVYSIDSLLVGEFARQRVLIAVSIQKLWMRGGSSSVTFGAQLVVYTNCWQTKRPLCFVWRTQPFGKIQTELLSEMNRFLSFNSHVEIWYYSTWYLEKDFIVITAPKIYTGHN